MSITVSDLVWKNFPTTGSKLLVMLAMADWSNNNGELYCRSVQTIANKVKLSPVQTQKVIVELQKAGYISTLGDKITGGAIAKSYSINLKKICSTPLVHETPITGETPIVDECIPPSPARDAPLADDMAPYSYINKPLNKTIKPKPVVEKNLIAVEPPAWIATDLWTKFIEHRKALGKPLSLDAQKFLIEDLEKIRSQSHDVEACIKKSITNGWPGVYPPREQQKESEDGFIEKHFNGNWRQGLENSTP